MARTIEVDAKGGPRFGQNQYPTSLPLKDGEVVLTFDDGPHKSFTKPILDALDAHCTKATFFMVGQRALSYPDIVRNVAKRGHTIATHTWSHQNLAKITTEEAKAEIELGISAVQKALGTPAAPFFRFPYLSDPSEMKAHLRTRNTANLSIDVDSYDFKTKSPTVVIRNVLKQLEQKRSGIILFHDIQPSTAGALDTLLTELKQRGFKVVHIIPTTGQTTVAEFDKKVTSHSGKIAALPLPVSQRGVMSTSWDVQIYRGPNEVYGRARGSDQPAKPPSGLAQVPAPPPQPTARPQRRAAEDDWKSSIFRSW